MNFTLSFCLYDATSYSLFCYQLVFFCFVYMLSFRFVRGKLN